MLKITQPPTIFMEIAFEKSITPGNTDIMGPFISLQISNDINRSAVNLIAPAICRSCK